MINEWMKGRTEERKDGMINEWMNGRMEGRKEGISLL